MEKLDRGISGMKNSRFYKFGVFSSGKIENQKWVFEEILKKDKNKIEENNLFNI